MIALNKLLSLILLQLLLLSSNSSLSSNWKNNKAVVSSPKEIQKVISGIDSLLAVKSPKPFNGLVLISRKGKIEYIKSTGYSDVVKKTPLKSDDQFIVGSISKQITAVLVLQEFEKGHIKLDIPIHTYLPELKQKWADTVTVHHLLTHIHGIESLDKPTLFKPGSAFNYSLSNLGYILLSQILEKTSGKTFAGLSSILFGKCGMKLTFHPDIKKYHNLVKGYTEQNSGELKFESAGFQNAPAAGGFISTANDLMQWNEYLHNGKLLKPDTYKMMISKKENAIRQHLLSGITEYGYGITIDNKENILQLGQTGFAPGFASMNFYFPETKTSVIVLNNVAYDTNDLRKTFSYHMKILKMVRN